MTFDFTLPSHLAFGVGRFGLTHKLVRGFGKKALIVTSRGFAGGGPRAAVLDELLSQLGRIGVETRMVSDIEPNPRAATIDRAAAIARDFRPRYVLALGGGSVMDAAKCVALLAVNDGEIIEYAYRGPGRPMKAFNHALPIVCVPTAAATGSESSIYAVVTHEASRRKVAIFNDALRPALSIIDPALTYTVSARQTVDGAFDIVTHVLESYLSAEASAPLQDRFSEAIVETVATSLPRALANPRDELARSSLSWCASLALSGILNGREGGWPVHALEHALSAATDLAHGRGLALLLPRVMSFDSEACAAKLERLNTRLFGARSLDDGFFRFMRDVGAWTTLETELPRGTDLDAVIAATADHALEIDGIWRKGEEPFLPNVRPLYRRDIAALLLSCRD